jgi:hypothetical protein
MFLTTKRKAINIRNIQQAMAAIVSVLLMFPGEGIPQARPVHDWAVFQTLAPGAKLRIEFKRSKPIEGRLVAASDASISMSTGGGTRTVQQSDVTKAYLLSDKSTAGTTLKGTAIGAGAGAAVGAALGDNCSGGFGPCFSRSGLAMIGAAAFAIPGAIIGFIAGSARHRRKLIYGE